MGKYRIYPDKSNTIVENSQMNTGKNEVMELWYGVDGVSRHLIHFDFSEYVDKYSSGILPHITATTTIFNMDPCYPFFERIPYEDAYPAEASMVEVKVVQQFWDSGTGHDFYGNSVILGKSNWYSASSVSSWALNGGDFVYTVFSGIVESPTEKISFDVTDEVELWNTFTGQNHGFVVKFSDDVEELSGSSKHILKYYTNNVNTKYKSPYIEMNWDDQVKDQRGEVYPGSTKRLYMYSKKNGAFENVYSISSVTISFSTGTSITASTIHNPLVGIYYVDLVYPSNGPTGNTFSDTWAISFESGTTYSLVSQTGLTVAATSVWENSDSITSQEYTIETPNILNEYSKGDTIYLQINCRIPYTNTKVVMKNMEYKIDLIDGNMDIPFVDWEPVSYTSSENFIIFDTSWFHIDYKYKISIRYKVSGSIVSDPIEKKFWVR